MTRPKVLLVAVLALGIACLNDASRSPLQPNAQISDGAHSGGNTGFFFLPPMVPQPTITAPFNAFLQPLVRICRWATGCVSAPIDFTLTTGPGSEVIRVNSTDKDYHVNWHTDQFNVQPGEAYRIQVFADRDGQFPLGFADVAIAATGKQAKNLTTQETIGLVDGRTLPIKFFAGLGALGECDPDGPTCAEAIVSPEDGGLVVAVNGDGEPEAFADFPSDWANEPITVKLERLPNTPGPLGAPEGLHQWPLFYEFTAFVIRDGEEFPAGQFARRVRIGVCNIDNPFGDPDHPDDRGSVSLGIGAGDKFRTLPLLDATDILGLCEGITLAVRSGADASGWRAFLARAAAVATQVVLPRPLYAGAAVVVDGGMGGSTDSFESPVGTVKGRPDLVVHDISIFPTSPRPGDAITITAEIRNSGNLHAGRTLVTIDVSGQSPFERELSCPNLDEGEVPWTASLAPFENSEESCFVSRPVSFDAAGDFTVTARADAVGDLATESNEENNTLTNRYTVSPTAGLLLRYSFEGNANNTGALPGYDGTATSVTYPEGRFGSAIKFDGTAATSAILTGTAAVFATGSTWTISLWYREDAPPKPQSLLWEFRGADGLDSYHGVASSGGDLVLTTCSDGGCFSFANPPTGAWHNVVYRYDAPSATVGAPVDIYVDGTLAGTILNTAATPLIGSGVTDIKIGNGFSTVGGASLFYVDEFRVYNQVFTVAQQCTDIIGGTWTGESCTMP
jgi:hypothetical protein